jgi:hypothetical protein
MKYQHFINFNTFKKDEISLEYIFLLLCINLNQPENSSQIFASFAENQLNWSKIIDLAIYHKILPLLFINVKKHFLNKIPYNILQQLKRKQRQTGIRNLFLTGKLLSILHNFEKHNINAIPIKGPTLTKEIYGDISLRQFNDLDILIAPQSLEKAVKILFDLGYSPDIDLKLAQLVKLAQKGHHLTLYKENTLIELHWELTGRYFSKKITLESVWPEKVTTIFAEQEINSIKSEDLLIYLCIHGCRHHWHQLDAICCVAQYIKIKPNLNWEVIQQKSRNQGSTRMVALGLLLSTELLGIKLPEPAAKIINCHTQLKKTYSFILNRLFTEEINSPPPFTFIEFIIFHKEIMDRRSDWLQYCIRPLFNPTHSDWLWIRLPASLSVFYYFLRPLRLFIKRIRKLAG